MQVVLRDFDEYQEKATRTLAPDTLIMQLLHCAQGIAGEVAEIRRAELTFNMPNEIEEIGDCLWYCAVTCCLLGRPFQQVVDSAFELGEYEIRTAVNIDILTLASGDLLDALKRHAFYKKPLELSVFMMHLRRILQCLSKRIQFRHQLTMLRVCELNITKLSLRYGDKFSEYRVVNRDITAEQAIFTGEQK